MTKKKEKKTILDMISLDFKKIILSNIILNGIFLVMGIIIYFNPLVSLKVGGVIIGVYTIIFGLFNIYLFMMRREYPLFNIRLFLGVVAILIGIFTMVNPFHIVKIITFGLGIYLSVGALFKVLEALKYKKYGFDGWLITLVMSILLLVFGIFIAINPIASLDIVAAAGLFIMLNSILEIANLLLIYGKAQELKKLIK